MDWTWGACMSILADVAALHPTWTHGALVHRRLSGVTRAELVRHGFAVLGRPPATVLPDMTDDDVRQAAYAELCGYWAWAARRPLMWLNPVIADPGLTSMARGRHALATGLRPSTGSVHDERELKSLKAAARQRVAAGHVFTQPRPAAPRGRGLTFPVAVSSYG